MSAMVLAVDVGFRCSGLVVMQYDGKLWTCIAAKAVITQLDHHKQDLRKANVDMDMVARHVRFINKFIDEYLLTHMIVELPHGGGQSSRAVRAMALASAMIATLAELRRMQVEYYPPRDGKMAACGKQDASKDEVVQAMAKAYPNAFVGVRSKAVAEAMADALAIFEAAKPGNIVRGLEVTR